MRLCKADIACLCEMWGIAEGEQNTEAGALLIFQAASIKVV